MSWGPLLVNLAVTAGLVAVLMLATFLYAMRIRVHAIMDTIWPLGFVLIARRARTGSAWCWSLVLCI